MAENTHDWFPIHSSHEPCEIFHTRANVGHRREMKNLRGHVIQHGVADAVSVSDILNAILNPRQRLNRFTPDPPVTDLPSASICRHNQRPAKPSAPVTTTSINPSRSSSATTMRSTSWSNDKVGDHPSALLALEASPQRTGYPLAVTACGIVPEVASYRDQRPQGIPERQRSSTDQLSPVAMTKISRAVLLQHRKHRLSV